MPDYPDYTQLFNLVGSDIMVPIDIQGAYIMLPVDIQAQWATLEISIVAQTVEYLTVDIAAQSIGYLSINLAASDIILDMKLVASVISLDVNIKEITAGVTFNIGTIAGVVIIQIGEIQSVGLYLQAEWSAKIGDDIKLVAFPDNQSWGDYNEDTYVIAAGKVVFITSMHGGSYAHAIEDADKDQIMTAEVWTDITRQLVIGGNGGCSVTYPTPPKFAGPVTLRLRAFNRANHDAHPGVILRGYEVG